MRVFCQMARPELQHAAAAKGIDVFGLTCDELRCKLADCTPSQLKRFKLRCPLLERQTVSWMVLAGMAKAELQRAVAAKGIDVIGLRCEELRLKLADCTPSQLRCLRLGCPPAEPPIKTMRATRRMMKPELERVAAAAGINVTGLNRDELRLKLAGWTPRPLKVSSKTPCPPAELPSEANVVLASSDDDEAMISYDSPSSHCPASESDWSEAAAPEAEDVSMN